MVNSEKKEIKLKKIFRTYLENGGISDTLYNSISCFINKGYKIINNTDYSWCFTAKGYYKYRLEKGLKNHMVGLMYQGSKLKRLEGEQCNLISINIEPKDEYLIF